jgi:hypothetical protein
MHSGYKIYQHKKPSHFSRKHIALEEKSTQLEHTFNTLTFSFTYLVNFITLLALPYLQEVLMLRWLLREVATQPKSIGPTC